MLTWVKRIAIPYTLAAASTFGLLSVVDERVATYRARRGEEVSRDFLIVRLIASAAWPVTWVSVLVVDRKNNPVVSNLFGAFVGKKESIEWFAEEE